MRRLSLKPHLVHAQRAAARDEGVHPDVELEPVEEERPADVHLRDLRLRERHLVEALGQEDAAALCVR